MNVVADIILLAFLPTAVAAYLIAPPRRATVFVIVAGWLFLPVHGFQVEGVPNYTKVTAIALAAILGTAATQPQRLLFQPRWFDLPMAVWCIAPFFSSLTNGLGVYDGLSATFTQVTMWGVPWVIGRAWFSDAEGLAELARGVVIGGLVYVPLCLFEVRMSPILHHMVYGASPTGFGHTVRFGGYRPVVFMRGGLEVGMWMAAASLSALWLWSSGTMRQLWGVPMLAVVGVMWGTTVLCKSVGAGLLLLTGVGLLYLARFGRVAAPAMVLVVLVPGYMVVRSTGMWDGQIVVNAADRFSSAHAQSLDFRLHHEDLLVEKALERPVFGWGGWGRSRVHDEDTGEDISITDGMWVIAMGHNGLLGLSALTLAMLLPVVLLRWRCPPRWWRGPPALMAIIVLMFMVDSLLNAMPNPVYIVAAGAVCGMPALTMRAIGGDPSALPMAQAGLAAPAASRRRGAVRPSSCLLGPRLVRRA